MIEIYNYGCNCGIVGIMIRKVKRYARQNGLEVVIYNTKHNAEKRATHIELIMDLPIKDGLSWDVYPALVVYNGDVTLLKSWNL